jgi:tripartite-type tricarboxylate transporter receptor subunit TctC
MKTNAFLALCAVAAAVAAWGAATPLMAADFPDKPLRVYVPSPPGGTADTTARAFADKLSARWGKPVVVENRPGVGGLLGLNVLVQSPPDGHTLLLNTSASTTFPALQKTFALDYSKDFIQVTMLVEGVQFFAVHSSFPARTLDELVTYMRNNPGKVNVGSPNSLATLQSRFFGTATGTKFEIIAYPGAPQSGTALAAGEVHTILGVAAGMGKTLASGGRIRLLAVLGPTREPVLNLPSMADSQIPEVRAVANSAMFAPFWIGPALPAKSPPEAVAAIYAAARDIVKDPEFIKRMRDVELSAIANPPSPQEAQDRLIKES